MTEQFAVPSLPPAADMHARSFGFADVDPATRQGRVRGVFDSVASRYDIMNDAMSLGIHRLWKRDFLRDVRVRGGERVLDLAGGTGDLALQMAATTPHVTVCDITPAMLFAGRNRALDRGILPHHLHWTCGNAESLPFPDRTFNLVTIAFGLRNVTDIPRALREAHRVLKPGGRFFCLEFSPDVMPGLKPLYDLWSFQVIPRLGAQIAGDRASYDYLVESIRRFPAPAALLQMMHTTGFRRSKARKLSGGIVCIHQGVRV